MQVHERPQAAPALVLRGIKIRDLHAKPCTLWMHGFFRKNSGIFGDFFAYYRVASSARRRV